MSQAMTRKQALAVLHMAKSFLYQSRDYVTAENEPFRQEVLDAFSVLAQAIHGKPVGYRTQLCDHCHLDYGSYWIEYYEEGQGYTLHLSLCPSCLEEAKHHLTLISIDFQPYQQGAVGR